MHSEKEHNRSQKWNGKLGISAIYRENQIKESGKHGQETPWLMDRDAKTTLLLWELERG